MKSLAHSLVNQVRKRGIQIVRMPPTLSRRPDDAILHMTLAHVLAERFAVQPDPEFFFVQIGGFDGRDALRDLVLRYDLSGLIVEPQTFYFKSLQETYADSPRVALRRAAVDTFDGERLLWRAPEDMPAWTQTLASFDREKILQHDHPGSNLRASLVSEPVPCVTFETLLAEVEHVDLLQIDTEGHDGVLMKAFDFARWQPSIVQFEHRYMSTIEHDDAIKRLVGHGYRVALSQFDTIACRGSESPAPRPHASAATAISQGHA